MKNRFIGVLVLLLAFCGTARADVLDSLQNNVRIAKDDTARYTAYVKLGSLYFARNLEMSHKYFWKALDCAERINDKSKIAVTYINISTLYSIERQFKKAVDTLSVGIRIAQEAKCRDELAFGYSQLGTICKKIGDNDRALEAFNKAIAIMNRSAVEDSIRKYRAQGTKITKKQDSYLNSVSIIYNDLALLHIALKDTTEAIDVFKFSLKAAEASTRTERVAVGYGNLGEIYSAVGKYAVAEEYMKKAIAIFRQTGSRRYEIITKDYLANMYIEKKDYAKAKKLVKEFAQKDASALGEYGGLCRTAAKLYRCIKNYPQALHYMKLAEENVGDSPEDILAVLKGYTDIYNESENYTKAFEYLEKYNTVKDSIYDAAQYEILANKLAFYQVLKKDDEINIMKTKLALTAEQEKQQQSKILVFVISTVALVVIVFVLIVLIRSRRRNEKQISEKNDELETANEKLTETNATKDKFFSIIAHDLRNPIGSFRNVVELMHDDYDSFDEEERKDFLRMMKKSSEQVFELLENLLEWSRSQRGTIKFNPTKIDIFAIAQLCVDLLTLTAEKKSIKLINSVPRSEFIYADAKLITTIIRNLMSNSVKFTREDGEIEVGYRELDNGEVEVSVRDTGVGMDAERVASLFQIDKSKSTNGTNGEVGTGLGLILCKEFVEMHGGKIWVESEVGIGSKFIFTLPQPEGEIMDSVENEGN